jgi:hypothetical protein
VIAYSLAMRRVSVRLYACAIGFAAMAAAASGHAAIDALAYLRLFSGAYAAYRHSGIVVAVVTVAAIAFGFALLTVFSATLGDLKRRFHVDRLAVLGALPQPSHQAIALVFCLQIPALLCIETLEQIQRYGHPLGIAASLGGPPLVALAIHAICALAVTMFSFRAIRAVAETVLTLARIVAPLILRTQIAAQAALAAAGLRTANATRRPSLDAPLALRIANRPPPLFALS